jgi:hypothetical protein
MTDRRSFLASLAVTPAALHATLGEPRSAPASGPWDFTWLDTLNGTYRQVFDCGELSNDPLHVVSNYLRGFREVMGLEHPVVNAVVGIAGRSFPINASDALWAKYRIADRWKIPPGADGKLLTTNPWAPMAAELKAQGAFFWQCNNALNRIAGWFAEDTGRPVAEVRAELDAGLLPGVTIVPAHTMFLGLVQHRGCTYEKL